MGDAGFYRGTNTEQDSRFSDKNKKLLKTMRFEECLEMKVDMKKVNLDVVKPWITETVTTILGLEDDVVIEFIFSQLEEKQFPDPKTIQINLTGFLNAKKSREFLGQLWKLLLEAQETEDGIPPTLVNLKKAEISRRRDDHVSVKRERSPSPSFGLQKDRGAFRDRNYRRRDEEDRPRQRSPLMDHRPPRREFNRDRDDRPAPRDDEKRERERRERDRARRHADEQAKLKLGEEPIKKERRRSPKVERRKSRTPPKRRRFTEGPVEVTKSNRRSASPDPPKSSPPRRRKFTEEKGESPERTRNESVSKKDKDLIEKKKPKKEENSDQSASDSETDRKDKKKKKHKKHKKHKKQKKSKQKESGSDSEEANGEKDGTPDSAERELREQALKSLADKKSKDEDLSDVD